MTPNVRIYASETGARDADAALAAAGYGDRTVLLPSEHAGREEAAVSAAIRDGTLPERYIQICTRNLKAGRSLVAVRARYGMAAYAVEIMERGDTVDTDVLRRYLFRDPTPLSDMLRIPALAKFTPVTGLLRSDWTLSSFFGLGLLSRKAAPLSSMFGLPTLSKPKREWKSSFGLPLLSRNPAPLSSLFGMATLSKPKGEWKSSFGLPLLSRNPAPLSSVFGISTKIKDPRKK